MVMFDHKVNRRTVWGWRDVFGSHWCIDELSIIDKKFFRVGCSVASLTQPCMGIVTPLVDVAI